MLAAIAEILADGTLALWFPNAALLFTPVAGVMTIAILAGKDAGRPLICCRRCGYDLRASNVYCPECGSALSDPASLGIQQGSDGNLDRTLSQAAQTTNPDC